MLVVHAYVENYSGTRDYLTTLQKGASLFKLSKQKFVLVAKTVQHSNEGKVASSGVSSQTHAKHIPEHAKLNRAMLRPTSEILSRQTT